MKGLSILASASMALAAKELSFSQQEYDSGAVHEAIMTTKHASWDRQRAAGEMESSQYPSFDAPFVPCIDGLATVVPGDANQTFKCQNMDLYDFKSHADLGSFGGEGSSSWGWISDDGREFVAVGQQDGTAFAEISKEGKLIYLGRLPQQSVWSIWREIRSYKNYILIGSEAVGHGVQIFDMTKLLTIDPANPVNFSTTADLTGLFNELPVGRTHNVVVNEELNYAVAVGAQPRNSSCAAGLIYIDLTDPSNPTSPGCAGQDGYVHDAHCLVYRGPDTKYYGRDICYGYNEDTLTIYDVTDKTGINTSTIISKLSYEGARYTHQGWTIDTNWQTHVLIDDELDETYLTGPAADRYPVTYIIDVTNLEAPVNTGYFKHKVQGIDHNLYVYDGLSYASNYGAGIRVWDVSSVPQDPTGGSVEEVAYFDIYPEDDLLEGGGLVDFVGTWSHFSNFPSGYILVNTIERGAFIVKMNQFEKRGRGRHYRKPRNV